MSNGQTNDEYDELESMLSGRKATKTHPRIHESVFVVNPDKKRLYLNLIQYLAESNVSLCLRDRGLNLIEAEPTEMVVLASKMIDNMTLNAILVRGLVGVLTNQTLDHRQTTAVMCENDVIYLYRIDIPFPTTKLGVNELLIGNFEPIILESVIGITRRELQYLPERYEEYQEPLKPLPKLVGLLEKVLPFCPILPVPSKLLARSEQIKKLGRTRPTSRPCLLLGQPVCLGSFSYTPSSKDDLRETLNDFWGYDVNPISILIVDFVKFNYKICGSKTIVVALTKEIEVNGEKITQGNGFLAEGSVQVKGPGQAAILFL